MRSIKPGRGPSAMGVVGSAVAVIFGIGWTAMAFAITRGSPFPVVGVVFPLFGFLFVGVGIASLIYNLRNTVSENRMSVLDITEDGEEPDPLNECFGRPDLGAGGSPGLARGAGATARRLKELDELKRSGLISDEEYQTQRKRILAQV